MKLDFPRPDQSAGLQMLWQAAFGDEPAFLELFWRTGFRPENCLALWQGNTPLAAAYWLDCTCRGEKAAYIYAVATAESHRGQGLCHRLMEQIHARLQTRGYAGSVLVPGSQALSGLYGTMGYRFFGGREEFSCLAGPESLPLVKCTAQEYAARRGRYLPAGFIAQEGPGLDFLAAQADFYQGEDLLFACQAAEGGLFFPEYLGSPSLAPGVLAALGADRGRFRGLGTEPFAMFRPLREGFLPTYLGFAFD